MNYRSRSWVVLVALLPGLLVFCAKRPSAEANESMAPVLPGSESFASAADDDEGPTPNCPVDAGGGANLPNGATCQNGGQCQSRFCSRLRNNTCQPCGGCAGAIERTVHGPDQVLECRTDTGGTLCTSAKHHPCAGDHDNVDYEVCIPVGNRPQIRTGRGVRCTGGPPIVAASCAGQNPAVNCANDPRKIQVSGLWRNDSRICD